MNILLRIKDIKLIRTAILSYLQDLSGDNPLIIDYDNLSYYLIELLEKMEDQNARFASLSTNV